jgi:predicted NBD/HSP70 family sugar kinase
MDGRQPDDLAAALIGLIGTRGPLSRAEASRLLKVSPARITQATRPLVDAGVLAESGTIPSGGGRPAILLDITNGRRRALGGKVTPNHLAFARVDLAGMAGEACSIDLDMRASGAIDRIVDTLATQVRDGDEELLGIGLALPGSPDRNGLVTSAILGWNRIPLATMIMHATGLPVFVENDVNALAIAAQLYDDGPAADDRLLVTIGYGIGCALTLDGHVYRGAHGSAGELGHIVVQPNGEPCDCGLTGCLETLIGDNALARRAAILGVVPEDGTKDDLNAVARAGHAGAADLFDWAGQQLGDTLASLVHVFDPEDVVISGEGVDVWEFWEPGFTRSLRAHLPSHRRDLRVTVRNWGEDTWARGAASLVFASPFDRVGVSSSGRRVRQMLREGL